MRRAYVRGAPLCRDRRSKPGRRGLDRAAEFGRPPGGHAGGHDDAGVGTVDLLGAAVDGGHRGGGDAAPGRRGAGVALRGRAAGAARAARAPRARRDPRAGARARHRPTRDGGRRGVGAAPPARRPCRDRPGARAVRRGGGDAPARAVRGGRGLPGRALPVPARHDARARPPPPRARGPPRRGPPFALHVHVAGPDAALAVRALDGVRAHVPVLLALAANPPFTRGADSGMASARTPVFQAFPRTGIPRAFGSYAAYVEAVDVLLRCGAIPEPTFIWWDVRLQPQLGTLEVRVMDAQTRIRDTAALAALVQCLVRLEALDGYAEPALRDCPEALDENRFLAARDGIAAMLVDPARDRCVPASGRLATLVDACRPQARALRCERELAMLAHLAGDPGATRQRAIASEPAGLPGLLDVLEGDFSPPRPRLAAAA